MNQPEHTRSCDAIVIGGGPAGSSAAALLAQAGRRSILIEQASFPRFHIGESLLPAGNKVLKAMGIWDDLEAAGCLKKWGAEFTCGDGNRRVEVEFKDSFIPGEPHAYQVERSRFDHMLLDKAKQHGTQVLTQTRVTALKELPGGGWQVHTQDSHGHEQTLQAPWLLDASGRARILARHLAIPRQAVSLPNRVAVFNHFTGVPRRDGPAGNNIIVVRIPGGWFWIIPLDSTRTSVGLVKVIPPGGPRANADLFHHEVANSPYMRRMMAAASPTQEAYHTEADYSYINARMAGPSHFMLGDAAGFLDPVFSSGVYLAMFSARTATDLILKHPTGPQTLSPREQRAYEHAIRSRMMSWLKLIQVFYHDHDFSIFMSPTHRFDMFRAVNAVVAGHPPKPFALRWRYALFLLACRINRHFPLVPRLPLGS